MWLDCFNLVLENVFSFLEIIEFDDDDGGVNCMRIVEFEIDTCMMDNSFNFFSF